MTAQARQFGEVILKVENGKFTLVETIKPESIKL